MVGLEKSIIVSLVDGDVKCDRELTLEGNGVEVIENNLFQLLVNLLLLPQDDISFPFNSATIELRVLENVADNIDRLRNILAEALGIVDSLLPRGIGIEVGTKILNLQLQRVLGTVLSTLESHMLEEVSSTVRLVSLRS